MTIYNIFIINRAGSLIYDYDSNKNVTSPSTNAEIELTFDAPPIDFKLENFDNRLTVAFGERAGVKVGYIVVSINDEPVLSGGRIELRNGNSENAMKSMPVLDLLNDSRIYPLKMKFNRPMLNTNEKIILSSMFHSLHAIAAQLSPVPQSSGIESLDTDSYRLQCFQTLTGIKFVVVADHASSPYLDQFLKKLYELYADFALKNPFYSLEMPVRCELFDQNVKLILDKFDKSGVICV
uniref:Trafficking protein particle complex subunit n=1 Tax=Romanomermis culicivorax TaxID=13658 RepID=A0A915HEL8_ROMCU